MDEMEFYGVTGRELGGIVEQLRLTDGVEVAIFLYQTGEEEYKVSLRSKKKSMLQQLQHNLAAADMCVLPDILQKVRYTR